MKVEISRMMDRLTANTADKVADNVKSCRSDDMEMLLTPDKVVDDVSHQSDDDEMLLLSDKVADDIERDRSDDIETPVKRAPQPDNCYLLKLPNEVQSDILKYACTHYGPIKPIVYMRRNLFWIATSLSENIVPEEALTTVNLAATSFSISNLVINEVMFYKNNEFEFESAQGMFHYLYALTDERRNAIKRVRFPYGSMGNHSSEPGPGMLILQYCSGLREITFDVDDMFDSCVIYSDEDSDHKLLIHDDNAEQQALLNHPKISALMELRGLDSINFVYKTRSVLSCKRPYWAWLPDNVTEEEHAAETADIVDRIMARIERKVNNIVRQPKTDVPKAINPEDLKKLRYGARIETRSKALAWESNSGAQHKS